MKIERFQGIAPWLTSVAIVVSLVTGVTRAAGQPDARDRSPELQNLIEQLVFQLDLVYRPDGPRHTRHYEQIRHALSTWNESTRNDADFELMKAWLKQSIRATAPGARQTIPPPPPLGGIVSSTWPSVRPPAMEAIDSPAPLSTDKPDQTVQREPPTQTPAGANPGRGQRAGATSPTGRPTDRQATPAPEPTNVEDPAQRDFWSNHPSNQPLPVDFQFSNPFEDDFPNVQSEQGSIPNRRPLTSASPENKPIVAERDRQSPDSPHLNGRPTKESVVREAVAPGSSSAGERGSGPLNLAELRARVQGYNQGLRRVRSKLVAHNRLPGLQLVDLAEELSSLLRHREFIQLYLDTLTDSERDLVPAPGDPQPCIRLMADGILAARRRARVKDPLATGDQDAQERQHLDEAARQLAKLRTRDYASP